MIQLPRCTQRYADNLHTNNGSYQRDPWQIWTTEEKVLEIELFNSGNSSTVFKFQL